MMKKNCAWCGKEFSPKHGNSKYCSPKCQKEAKRKANRKAQRKYYWKNKKIEIEIGAIKHDKGTESYGVINTISMRPVTDGLREPLVFETKQEALKWFRENGSPEELTIVHGFCGVSQKN